MPFRLRKIWYNARHEFGEMGAVADEAVRTWEEDGHE